MIKKRGFMPKRPPHWTMRESGTHTEAMSSPDPWAPTDPLGEALHFLRMNGAFYCRSELTAEWGLTVPPLEDHLWFHVVTSGGGWLETDGAEATFLRPGTLRSSHTDGATVSGAHRAFPPPGSSSSSASK